MPDEEPEDLNQIAASVKSPTGQVDIELLIKAVLKHTYKDMLAV